MADVREVFDCANATSVRTLVPGQLGKVSNNGTIKGRFVMGIPHTILADKTYQGGGTYNETIFAIYLDTGELIKDDGVIVIAYPDHVLLEIRPSQNMGTIPPGSESS